MITKENSRYDDEDVRNAILILLTDYKTWHSWFWLTSTKIDNNKEPICMSKHFHEYFLHIDFEAKLGKSVMYITLEI